MKKLSVIATVAFASAAFLSGCAAPGYYSQSQPYPAYPPSTPASGPIYPASASLANPYGTIDTIRVTQAAPSGSGAGAVVGGLVGGLLGNQVGSGRGRTAATVAGTIAGAVVGDQLEQRNAQTRDMYQIGVRLDNGGYQTVTQESVVGLQVGNRVRIDNERVYRY